MPRKPCYWTRKLEMQLVDYVRQREFIWKPMGNTNHHIQQKYKAYAEFAAKLGRGFTARSVRDRWVNIRSTFNHNLRRVDKSRESAQSAGEVYLPCWPLWKPLQFLRTASRRDNEFDDFGLLTSDFKELSSLVKDEPSNLEDMVPLRQRGQRTDRPRKRKTALRSSIKCKRVVEDLLKAMKPIANQTNVEKEDQSYWFFGKHVTERLNCMTETDAKFARRDILEILTKYVSDIKPSSESENLKFEIDFLSGVT